MHITCKRSHNKAQAVFPAARRRLNIIKSFYVKFERKIPALVDDFCRYYAEHSNKTVVYYFDATALGSNYAVNEQDYRWWVVHEFERRGGVANPCT